MLSVFASSVKSYFFPALICLVKREHLNNCLSSKLPCHLGGTKVARVCGYKKVAHNHLNILKYFCVVSLK